MPTNDAMVKTLSRPIRLNLPFTGSTALIAVGLGAMELVRRDRDVKSTERQLAGLNFEGLGALAMTRILGPDGSPVRGVQAWIKDNGEAFDLIAVSKDGIEYVQFKYRAMVCAKDLGTFLMEGTEAAISNRHDKIDCRMIGRARLVSGGEGGMSENDIRRLSEHHGIAYQDRDVSHGCEDGGLTSLLDRPGPDHGPSLMDAINAAVSGYQSFPATRGSAALTLHRVLNDIRKHVGDMTKSGGFATENSCIKALDDRIHAYGKATRGTASERDVAFAKLNAEREKRRDAAQDEAVIAIESELSRPSVARTTVIMATGIGKTHVARRVMSDRVPDRASSGERQIYWVPTKTLTSQVLRILGTHDHDDPIRTEYLVVCSDASAAAEFHDRERRMPGRMPRSVSVTTDEVEITKWLAKKPSCGQRRVVVSTYRSSVSVRNAIIAVGIPFDLSVHDEAHRCAPRIMLEIDGSDEDEVRHFAANTNDDSDRPDIPWAKQRLFMTGTLRVNACNKAGKTTSVISMDDEDRFGRIVHEIGVGDAQRHGILPHLSVHAIYLTRTWTSSAAPETTVPSGPERIGQAASALLRLVDRHPNLPMLQHVHERGDDGPSKPASVVCFFSRIEQAKAFKTEMNRLATRSEGDRAICEYLDGEDDIAERSRVFRRMETASPENPCVLAVVRIADEGVDIPRCDAGFFMDPGQSTEQILQRIGRILRWDHTNPLKVARIVIPVMTNLDPSCDIELSDRVKRQDYSAIVKVCNAICDCDQAVRDLLTGCADGRFSVEAGSSIGVAISMSHDLVGHDDDGANAMVSAMRENLIGVSRSWFGSADMSAKHNAVRDFVHGCIVAGRWPQKTHDGIVSPAVELNAFLGLAAYRRRLLDGAFKNDIGTMPSGDRMSTIIGMLRAGADGSSYECSSLAGVLKAIDADDDVRENAYSLVSRWFYGIVEGDGHSHPDIRTYIRDLILSGEWPMVTKNGCHAKSKKYIHAVLLKEYSRCLKRGFVKSIATMPIKEAMVAFEKRMRSDAEKIGKQYAAIGGVVDAMDDGDQKTNAMVSEWISKMLSSKNHKHGNFTTEDIAAAMHDMVTGGSLPKQIRNGNFSSFDCTIGRLFAWCKHVMVRSVRDLGGVDDKGKIRLVADKIKDHSKMPGMGNAVLSGFMSATMDPNKAKRDTACGLLEKWIGDIISSGKMTVVHHSRLRSDGDVDDVRKLARSMFSNGLWPKQNKQNDAETNRMALLLLMFERNMPDEVRKKNLRSISDSMSDEDCLDVLVRHMRSYSKKRKTATNGMINGILDALDDQTSGKAARQALLDWIHGRCPRSRPARAA